MTTSKGSITHTRSANSFKLAFHCIYSIHYETNVSENSRVLQRARETRYKAFRNLKKVRNQEREVPTLKEGPIQRHQLWNTQSHFYSLAI